MKNKRKIKLENALAVMLVFALIVFIAELFCTSRANISLLIISAFALQIIQTMKIFKLEDKLIELRSFTQKNGEAGSDSSENKKQD